MKQYSEYGCNEVQPRIFTEVGALYGKEMTSLSGGLVYEYSQEEADYGLVVINDNGTVSLREDFHNLQGQFNKLDLSLIQSASNTNLKAPKCDKSLITAKQFSSNFTIPAVCPGCADVIKNGLKNPTNGKLVDVTDTKPKQAVYGANGVEIKNLELTKLKEANTPSGSELSSGSASGTASGTAAQPSATKTGAASSMSVAGWSSLMVAGALLTAMLA